MTDNENEAWDPFEATKRKFTLYYNMATPGDQSDQVHEDAVKTQKEVSETTEFFHATTSELQKKIEEINELKKEHDAFEREMNSLKNNTAPLIIDNSLGKKILKNKSRTGLGIEIINLIQESAEQKLKVMQLQLENERRQTEKLNELVKSNMAKIIHVDEILRKKLGDEISGMIENTSKQKLQVLESQLQREQKQSSKLNEIVKKDMDEILKFDLEIRTEGVLLEKEVIDKTDKLLKAERLSVIGKLAASVAHDLRNPLSVIKASIELIKIKSVGNDKIEKQIRMIDRSVSRMLHQIEDVLDFIKPMPLQIKTYSLLETIHDAIEKANIPESIKIELPENDFEFNFDKSKMDVVFDNIFTNASQAIEKDGFIIIKIIVSNAFVTISIMDSGPGIDETIFSKVFDPLVTSKQAGTGLGLASCKSIVEQHKGTISVQNYPTTFIIKLPKTSS